MALFQQFSSRFFPKYPVPLFMNAMVKDKRETHTFENSNLTKYWPHNAMNYGKTGRWLLKKRKSEK